MKPIKINVDASALIDAQEKAERLAATLRECMEILRDLEKAMKEENV